MGKYLSIIIGGIVALLGLWGLMGWWSDFILVLRGSVPVILIFAGIIAVIAGLSELRDESASKKEEKK